MSKAFQSERHLWLYIRAKGKARFVRGALLGSLLVGVVISLGFALLDHSPSHLARAAIMLGVCLLVGCLTACQLWQNLEKRFSEDRLPPWE
jgi:uncharacterized membrane protein YczE